MTILDACDIAVIGGGVVGCAVARRMTLEGADVVLLEKAPDILEGASKGNSAILHTGFDAPSGTLELRCMQDGYAEYLDLHEEMNLPLRRTGALVVAWTEEEEHRLTDIVDKAHRNGVTDVRRLSAAEALDIAPALAGNFRGAVHVPGEALVDPWSAPLGYLTQAVRNGARVYTRAPVTAGDFDGREWSLSTPRGEVRARHVVNCAGLYGDEVDAALLGTSDFEIRPRKGQFVVFDKAAGELLDTIVLPVPTARTKGIVVCPTVFGNILVGPTAEDQESREDASVDSATLRSLMERAVQIVPALAGMPVTATYAGIRPATEESGYRIRHLPERHWLTLGGIRSTGLTAALGLARLARDMLEEAGNEFAPLADPVIPRMPNLAEHLPRDHATPGYGEMVCHCELVTLREIRAALESPVPPGTLGGLKRRTRATMGRCQGFYCMARLAAMAGDAFDEPLVAGEAHVAR